MQITWSGLFTPYTEAKVKAGAPALGGVYLLWVQLKNEEWICFYGGQAGDLRERLLDHLSDGEENDCVKENVSKYICGFEFAKVAKQTNRDGIEKFLYDHYKPECNQVDPGGTPIEVNLP